MNVIPLFTCGMEVTICIRYNVDNECLKTMLPIKV